jgi:hypothetical protein
LFYISGYLLEPCLLNLMIFLKFWLDYGYENFQENTWDFFNLNIKKTYLKKCYQIKIRVRMWWVFSKKYWFRKKEKREGILWHNITFLFKKFPILAKFRTKLFFDMKNQNLSIFLWWSFVIWWNCFSNIFFPKNITKNW